MKFRLNGKEITRSEYRRIFQGMTRWIEQQVQDAIDNDDPVPMFHTERGPLVIIVK